MTKLASIRLFIILVVFFIIVFQYSWEFSEHQQEKRQEELTNENSSNIKNINLFDKIGGSFGILLNPAPSSNNHTINPFEFRDVRFAINYLINRIFISNEILHGYGIPMSDPFGLFSPDYPVVLDTVESFAFHYDPDYAVQQIKKTLTEHGATLKDDKWYFKD